MSWTKSRTIPAATGRVAVGAIIGASGGGDAVG